MNLTQHTHRIVALASVLLTALTVSDRPDASIWHPAESTAISAPIPSVPMQVMVRIDGVHGSSTTRGYEDWIEAENLVFSMSVPAASRTGGGAGRPSIEPIQVAGDMADAVVDLLEAATTGEQIPEVRIQYLLSGVVPAIELRLRDVLVTKIGRRSNAVIGSASTVQFTAGRIEWTSSWWDGGRWHVNEVRTGWSVSQNRAL